MTGPQRLRIAVAAGMGGMGIATMLRPAVVFDSFGMTGEGPEARNEVRAVYGGYGLAMAALLGWAATGTGPVRAGVSLTVGCALSGMAAGRIVSARVDPPSGLHPVWTYCGLELAGAAALFASAVPARQG